MNWIICRNYSSLPLLTSDNPVVMWADRGEGAEIGVGFHDPKLQILFPLTPHLCMMCLQTPDSLESALQDRSSGTPQINDIHPLKIARGGLGIEGTKKLNQITVSNAERYVYGHSNDEKVLLFLRELFFRRPGPVRRFDRNPIGSEIEAEPI